MNKLILTDVDETVLQFADPFQQWLETQGIKPLGRLRESYNVEQWLGVDLATAIDLMKGYTDSHLIDTQPPEECALEVLPELHKMGYRFVAITACGLDEVFTKKRRKTLEETFGFKWVDMHVVELGGKKVDYLRRYNSSIWVEDHFGHAVDGAGLGHRSYLMDRAYNASNNHPDVRRVTCWRELRDLLNKKEK